MKYLHTMVRVANIEDSLDFYCNKLGLTEINRYESEEGRFTLVFLAAPSDEAAQVGPPQPWPHHNRHHRRGEPVRKADRRAQEGAAGKQ